MDKTNTAKFKAFNSLVEVSIARKYVYRIPHMSFFSFCLMKITHHPKKKNKKNKLHHGCPTMLTIPHLSPTKDEVTKDQNGFVRHVLNAHLDGHSGDSGALVWSSRNPRETQGFFTIDCPFPDPRKVLKARGYTCLRYYEYFTQI